MSAATLFTPGPWLRDRASGFNCDVRAASGRKVALCWGLTTGSPLRPAYLAECDANAVLIATAPDMLAMLQHVVRWHDQLSPKDIEAARSLIEVALGTSPALPTPEVLSPSALAEARAFGAGLDDQSLEQPEVAL